uniref:Craniofacial development protein 2 n=1 Tax=Cacopsylla melanoneura TaxID=428564 RepID=A0A8D8WQC9_9HEMI
MIAQQQRLASDHHDFVNARASPSDAQVPRLTSVTNVRGLPAQGRDRLKRLVQKEEIRIGTLNVGSMTGRGREVADLMRRRRIQILCVQETRWRGNKAKELGDGYKLIYSSANEEGRNGVGIVLDEDMKTKVTSVNRKSDRVMNVKLQLDDMELNVLSTYAPQVGCEDEVKDAFWRDVEEEFGRIPDDERVFLGGDLNGHIGKGNTETTERIRGIWGLESQNEEGERIIDFALGSDMAILNTFFKKEDRMLVTYKSGERISQIDFILCRRQHMKEVRNCKIINGESVAPQHRVLVIDVLFDKVNKKKKTQRHKSPKIKWWNLKDPFLKIEFQRKVIHTIRNRDYQDLWNNCKESILQVGENVLGKTSGKGKPKDKETWWWNEEVKAAIKKKKDMKKKKKLFT